MERVKNYQQLDPIIKSYLDTWFESSGNKCMRFNYINQKHQDYIVKNAGTSIFSYNNDVDFVERINNMSIPTSHKLLFYHLYNPYIATEEDFLNFFMNYNTDLTSFSSYKLIQSVFDDFVTKKLGVQDLQKDTYWKLSDFVLKMINQVTPKIELLENLYLVDKFLNNAKDEETFEDFFNKQDSLINSKGQIDLSLFESSKYLTKLANIFERGSIGAMGEMVNKGVTAKLKQVPKATYLQLLELPESKCKTIQALETALNTVNKMGKTRDSDKNISILLSLVFLKLAENKNYHMREILAPITAIFSFPVSYRTDKILDGITTEIADLVVENKDLLSASEIIAMLLPFYYKNFWVRTGNVPDSLTLLLKLCKENTVGTAQLLEYLAFENTLQPPTITQWNSVSADELFGIVPAFALSLVNNTEKERSEGNLYAIRSVYKKGWLK